MFYVENGKLKYLYNFVGLQEIRDRVHAGTCAREAPSQDGVRLRWRWTRKRRDVTLYIDGNAVGSGRVEQTAPMVFSADETSDVGLKRGSPMIAEMPAGEERL